MPASCYLNYGFIDPSPVHAAIMSSSLVDDNAELVRQNAELREQIAALALEKNGATSAMRADAPAFCPGVPPRCVADDGSMKERRQRFKTLNRKVAPKKLEVSLCELDIASPYAGIASPSASTTCSGGFSSEDDESPKKEACRAFPAKLRVRFASEVEVILFDNEAN